MVKIKLIRQPSQLFWLGYFALSILVIGSLNSLLLVIPLSLLGLISSNARKAADRALFYAIKLLMRIQPWFRGEVDFQSQIAPCTLIVSNHRSTLDAFILLSQVRGLKILAKKSLFSFPGIGWMMWVTRQIPVKSGDMKYFFDAMEMVRIRLRAGETVHVFPEMTRCSPGYSGMLSFSLVPFRIAFQEGFPVIPVVFKGTDDVWPKGKLGLRYGKPVKAIMLKTLDSRSFATAQDLKTEVENQIKQALQ